MHGMKFTVSLILIIVPENIVPLLWSHQIIRFSAILNLLKKIKQKKA